MPLAKGTHTLVANTQRLSWDISYGKKSFGKTAKPSRSSNGLKKWAMQQPKK